MSSKALCRSQVHKAYASLIEQDCMDVIGHLHSDERVYFLIESCKLNTGDPSAYSSSTLTAVVTGHRRSRLMRS